MRILNLISGTGRLTGVGALLVPIVMTTSVMAQKPVIIRPLAPRPAAAQQNQPVVRAVKIDLTGLTYKTKDDPFPGNNDEPYLIGVGFKAKLQTGAGGAVSAIPNTVEVWPVGFANHKDLGHTDSNWAKEGGRYQVKGQTLETSINVNEPGWIVGEASFFFEEDDWGNKQVDQAKAAIIANIKQMLASMNVAGVGSAKFGEQVLAKVSSNVSQSFASFKMKDIYHSLLSAINPDDFGGVNMVLISTTENENTLKVFAGDPGGMATIPSLTKTMNVSRGTVGFENFTWSYKPNSQINAIVQMDPAGRYSGFCTFSGYVQVR